MSYKKKFKNYEQLFQHLIDKGLLVGDKDTVIDFLGNIHYYRLSVYFIPFYSHSSVQETRSFIENTSFEDICSLYCFDQELKSLVLKYLEKIEIALRAQIVHIHAESYGAFGYVEVPDSLKRELSNKRNKKLADEFLEEIRKIQVRSSEDFVKHIRKKYQTKHLPIWAVVEILSFGSLVKFFKLLHKKEQLEIMKHFGIEDLRLNVFTNWLETLVYVRNICAHHSRLWNKKFVRKFKFDEKYEFLNTEIQKDKVFFAISALMEILKDNNLQTEFLQLLEKYPKINLGHMGFPKDWQTIYPWNQTPKITLIWLAWRKLIDLTSVLLKKNPKHKNNEIRQGN